MFISRHTLKWTKTCRSSGDFPHAHTAHFLLNRHRARGVFTVMCDRLASIAEFEAMRTSRRDAWPDLECALRTRNYGLYKAAAARLL